MTSGGGKVKPSSNMKKMHRKKCRCLLKAQRSQRIGMYAIVMAINKLVEIVRAKLQRSAKKGPKRRPTGKSVTKVAH